MAALTMPTGLQMPNLNAQNALSGALMNQQGSSSPDAGNIAEGDSILGIPQGFSDPMFSHMTGYNSKDAITPSDMNNAYNQAAATLKATGNWGIPSGGGWGSPVSNQGALDAQNQLANSLMQQTVANRIAQNASQASNGATVGSSN